MIKIKEGWVEAVLRLVKVLEKDGYNFKDIYEIYRYGYEYIIFTGDEGDGDVEFYRDNGTDMIPNLDPDCDGITATEKGQLIWSVTEGGN